ncbi:Type II secretion system protein F [bioreactor metagenome]|uniref:Type II secretion system protein F n=1 Tax=bioreactor metagenome TaxID=1076179 RepID=A0A645AYR8_9ZZZZ
MQGASQFANTMSTLLAAGLPMVRAVAVSARVLSNYALGLSAGAAVSGLEEGKTLGECLGNIPQLPHLLVEMAAVGEETGSLESTLDVVGAFYDNEVELATARLLSLLEPTITVVLAGMALLILLSVYLPMFSMYGAIGA